MAEKTIQRAVTMAGRRFELSSVGVAESLRDVEPEPIVAHYVVIAGRRFPPKQVLAEVTGLDRADFTSHQARRTLMRLGFPVGRRSAAPRQATSSRAATPPTVPERRDDLADQLRELAGQWVAIAGGEVLHAAASPHGLVSWLTRHGVVAESMFRAPENDLAASGLAPL